MKKQANSSGISALLYLALAAFILHTGFLLWVFLQDGTIGTYRWGYGAPILILSALGALPLVLVLTIKLIFKKKAFPKAGRVLIYAISILSLLIILVVGLFVLGNAYGPAVRTDARPVILDPDNGISVSQNRNERIFVSSDPHVDRDVSAHEERRAILSMAQKEYSADKLDAFFVLGDYVEYGLFASGWKKAVTEFGTYAPDVPFVCLMGNHDSIIGGRTRWSHAFGPPSGKPKNALSTSSFRIDAGKLHFISLDCFWDADVFGKREQDWLVKQLASIPEDHFTIVLSHAFFYSSGYIDKGTGKPWYDNKDMITKIAPFLEGKADLVVSGHNHYMEWLKTSGTAWAIIGAMGGIPDPEPFYYSPYSEWQSYGIFGYLELELTEAGLLCTFRRHDGKELYNNLVKPKSSR